MELMRIAKVNIENFKCFKGKFSLNLNDGANILVGNNEAGKTTILEAIHLGLTGILNGRYLRNELSQYLFNRGVERAYINSLAAASASLPPHILIELFLSGEDSSELNMLKGNGNSEKNNTECGISYRIEFDEQYQSEYAELRKTNSIFTSSIKVHLIALNAGVPTILSGGLVSPVRPNSRLSISSWGISSSAAM